MREIIYVIKSFKSIHHIVKERERECLLPKYIKRNIFNKHLNTYHLDICNYTLKIYKIKNFVYNKIIKGKR